MKKIVRIFLKKPTVRNVQEDFSYYFHRQ